MELHFRHGLAKKQPKPNLVKVDRFDKQIIRKSKGVTDEPDIPRRIRDKINDEDITKVLPT
jgi:hypothetical protein